ncbi:MAG: hypothetical protein ABR977_14030 [Candidatus Dormibacteria bacterium]
MGRGRILGFAGALTVVIGAYLGTALPAAATGPSFNSIVISSRPVNGSLANGTTWTYCVQAEEAGTAVSGATVYLSFDDPSVASPAYGTDVPPGDTSGPDGTTGGSAAVGVTPLSATPTAFTTPTSSCTSGTGAILPDAIDVTYTSPDIAGSTNAGAPYPVWGGRDWIAGQDNPTPTIPTAIAQYEFSPVTSYSFSTGATIAANATLTTGQQVDFTVQANDGGGPVADASVLLWLSSAASPGGTVTAVGGAPPSGTFCTMGAPATLTSQSPSVSAVRCITNMSGQVSLVYTASSATTTVGIDDVTAQSHPTHAFSASTSYGYQAAGAYTPLKPFRLCDTRSAASVGYTTECTAHGALAAGSTMTFAVTGQVVNSESVPDGAQAVVVNLTAIDGSASTFLTMFPAGSAVPTASNLNVGPGNNEANLVVVALGTGGELSLYNSQGSIDVAVDVEGYFAAPTGASGTFHPIAPLRLCDTRSGMDTACSGTPLTAGAWQKVVVSGCPEGDPGCSESVPSDGTAEAVALNLTAVDGSSGTYLSVVPPNGSDACPTTTPSFSNLNVGAAHNLPNRVIVPLGPDQDVCVYNSLGTINYILDINGWFGDGSESTPGALFYAVSPLRLCDSRGAADVDYATECSGETLTQGDTLTIPVAGVDGLPTAAGANPPVAVIANVTAVNGTAGTLFTLYPAGIALPLASDLNINASQNIPNLVIVQLSSSGAVDLFNDLGTINAVVDVAGWFQDPA